jgi:hypothetical protein
MYSKSFLKLSVFMQCVLITFTCGCSEEEPYVDWKAPTQESISETNKIRKERGIRQIKDSWTYDGLWLVGGENGLVWNDQAGDLCKTVCLDTRYVELRSETDYYFSGASFSDPDGDGDREYKEHLEIRYYYGARRFALSISTENKELDAMVEELPEDIRFPTRLGGFCVHAKMGATNSETLEIADRILAKWGKKRL